MAPQPESGQGVERQEVLFRGDVQGVGFRYTTERIAREFAVVGFVRNLPDGSVQLVAEGTREAVDGFRSRVEREMAGNIEDRELRTSPASGEFTAFEIRF